MRRLVTFLGSMAVAQALLLSILAPLLPTFERDLGLSKSQVGLVVGAFAVGQALMSLPVGFLVSRVGVREFALVSIVTLGLSSAALGIVDTYGALLATLVVQGAGVSLCWSSGLAWLITVTPPERRSWFVGMFAGAASAGQVLGPVIGAVAVVTSRAVTFGALACGAGLLTILGGALAGPVRDGRQSLRHVLRAHCAPSVLGALWLASLPAMLMGAILVLAPLRFDRLGWGPVGIAASFLVAALVGVLARPFVGRWSDRRGLVESLRLLALAAAPLTLGLPWLGSPWLYAAGTICAVTAYGVMWGPTIALVSRAYGSVGVSQVFGFALMQTTIGVGIFLGAAAGGRIAQSAGDAVAAGLFAAVCVGTALGTASPRSAT